MMIHIHDVGHGGCAVITCPNGARIMLDCGFRLDPEWFPSVAFGGEFIDLLVFMNLDEDHVNDLPYMCDRVRLGAIFSNPTVTAAALAAIKHEHGMDDGVRHVHSILARFGPGMIGCPPLDCGGVQAWAYWNLFGLDFTETNNLSLAVFVRYGGFTILFAGDLETGGWHWLLRRPRFVADLATVNVLVASHHGRANGRCEKAFKIFKPDVVVFSDDERQYDSQNTDAWYRQRSHGIPDLNRLPHPILGYRRRHVLTTRRDGTMTIKVEPSGKYLVTPSRGTPALSPLALALFGQPAA